MTPRGPEAGRAGPVRAVLLLFSVLAALMGALHLAVMVWARHEMTQVESFVAGHSLHFSRTGHIYYDLNRYPFTVSAYMPLFYSASAVLDRLGLPALLSGRLVSASALLAALFVCWRLLGMHVSSRYARWTGILLIASTANLWTWGTVGQVDWLGLMFSLAAFDQYSRYRSTGDTRPLVRAAMFWVLAVFTKQTMLASGAAMIADLLLHNRKRALWFALGTGAAILAGVTAVNLVTAGRFFDNVVRVNMNPWSWKKLADHLGYFALTGGSLLIVVLPGLRKAWNERSYLHLYLGAAGGLFLLTSPKISSDLNYQLETLVVLGACAAWTLDRLRFFPALLAGSWDSLTLLQMPLLLHVVVNLGASAVTILSRVALEPVRRQEAAALRPFLEKARGPVISAQIDPVLQARGPADFDPLVYTMCVKAGIVDPELVRSDLEHGRIPLVILFEDISGPQWFSSIIEQEMPTLPEAHLAELRKHYRLAGHVPGAILEGDFLYEPIRTGNPERNTSAP